MINDDDSQITKTRTKKLQNDERLQSFGLFRSRYQFNYSAEREHDKRFVEDLIKKIDLEYPIDQIQSLNYDLSALLSVINDTDGKKFDKSYKPMPDRIRYKYEYLRKILREEDNKYDHDIFDHIYWYQDKPNDILTIETHPYGRLNDRHFKVFSKAKQEHPELYIEVLPNSYYFANHTLYIKFIITKASKFGLGVKLKNVL